MKVMLVHNYYKQAGGEDNVVAAEENNLKENGIDVVSNYKYNSNINTLGEKVKTAFNLCYSSSAKADFSKSLKIEKPDVVHVHNFFPLFTPSIYDACIDNNIPVVQTIHNFRLICASALLYRKNSVCERCLSGSIYQSVLRRCYKNSYISSLALAHMISYHKKRNTWGKKVSKIIALTNFAKDKLIEGGIEKQNLMVKPNFVEDPHSGNFHDNFDNRQGLLFVGRMSDEKGVDILLKAVVKSDYKLTLLGGGPELNKLKQNYESEQIQFLGEVSSNEVGNYMSLSQALVVPSKWYEGFPMVILEAYSRGLPVISSNLGSLGDVIKDGKTGLHFNTNDDTDLKCKLDNLMQDKDLNRKLSLNARFEYEKYYSPLKNIKQQLDIYDSVIR